MMAVLSTEPLQREDLTFQPYCTRNGKPNLCVPVGGIHFLIHFPNPITTGFFPALVFSISSLGFFFLNKPCLLLLDQKTEKRDFVRVIIITLYHLHVCQQKTKGNTKYNNCRKRKEKKKMFQINQGYRKNCLGNAFQAGGLRTKTVDGGSI
jgi:hypothetical protein